MMITIGLLVAFDWCVIVKQSVCR